jgi:hypothetical protein
LHYRSNLGSHFFMKIYLPRLEPANKTAPQRESSFRVQWTKEKPQDNLQAFRDHWRELHTKRDATQEWLLDWIARIPPGCGCGESFESILQRIPARFDDWFAWTVEVHNAVNKKLSKPEITLAEAIKLWRDK